MRDLGDAVLLYDETDREPFWNRLAGVAWPHAAGPFDRRLTEALALFAGLDRIPHVWPMPGYDEPADLTERLLSHGFEDHGGGIVMVLDPERIQTAPPTPTGDGVTVERLHHLAGEPALEAARAIAFSSNTPRYVQRLPAATESATASAVTRRPSPRPLNAGSVPIDER